MSTVVSLAVPKRAFAGLCCVLLMTVPVRVALGFRAEGETLLLPANGWKGLDAARPVMKGLQEDAISQGRARGLHVSRDFRTGKPIRVRGKNLDDGRAQPGTQQTGVRQSVDSMRAKESLRKVAGLFAIKDVDAEFEEKKRVFDSLGFSHIRLAQQHNGLRVVGGEMVVRFDADGNAYQVDGKYIPVDVNSKSATITADEAVAIAMQLVKTPAPDLAASAVDTVVWGMGGAARLAHQIDLTASRHRWRVWVDANTAEVLLAFDNRHRIAAPTSNGADTTITGNILSKEGGQAVSVTGWREQNGVHYLYNKNRRWYIYNVATTGYADNNTYAYRDSGSWGSSDVVQMSAARNFDLTQQYFLFRHGRSSFNGAGIYARGNVHQGVDYVNAYWDGSDFHFGDGDGVYANALAVLDVVTHEFTHALTEYTANLTYYGESGALNESFSDIFGACVEFFAQPDGRASYPDAPAGHADWLLGEDCWLVSKSLRDMRNPRNSGTVGTGVQPSRYQGTHWYYGTGDNGGVHYNGGVQSFFFYLLCEGGSGNNDGIDYNLTGIGIANAEQVAYRALTVYCTPSTDYAAVRAAWISAAQDLNAAWVPNVQAAWTAVGVGSGGGDSGDEWDTGDDSGAGATALTMSTTEQQHGPHSLSTTDIHDWFRVYLSAGETYVFHTQGSSGDNFGELFSDSGGVTRVAFDDDSGGDQQFMVTYSPGSSGWYYLRVRGYTTGSILQYVLKYRQVGSTPDISLGAALDAEALDWMSGGDAQWVGQGTIIRDSVDAAQSGAVAHNQSSWFQTTLTGPGTLTFWSRVSSESGYDFLQFMLDSTEVLRRSGEGDWQQQTVSVGGGTQVARWIYAKDGSVASGSDQAWVDQVVWMPGTVRTPSGGQVLEARRPVFLWPATAGATWYRLWISRNGNTELTQWVEETTTWTPPADLRSGDYQWWVQPWSSAAGYGVWSESAAFSVAVSVPEAIMPIAPSGGQAERYLTYRWNKDNAASWYHLYVNRNGVNWLNKWYPMSGSGEGSVSVAHPGGSFTWWVQGWSPDGHGQWSEARAFSTAYGAPASPTLIRPVGMTGNRRPTFEWNAAERANWYRLYASRAGTPVVDRWLQDTVFTPETSLSTGDYQWWVAAWNQEGTTWSEGLSFTIGEHSPLYNMALTWGALPLDLDAYLQLPDGTYVYWDYPGSILSYPYSALDVDSVSGYGPESTSIYQAYSGVYKYFVHNYSQERELAGSGARVRLFGASGATVVDLTVPTSGSGQIWYVYDLDLENGTLTVRNTIQDTVP